MDRTRSASAMAITQARPNKWLSPGHSPLDAPGLSRGGVSSWAKRDLEREQDVIAT